MRRTLIVPDTCLACDPCAVDRGCELKAVIRESPDAKPWIDFQKCSGCMKCKTLCPQEAVDFVTQPCTLRPRGSW